MHAQTAVNARTLNTEHDTKVDAGPLRLLGPTVSTLVIARNIQEVKTKGVTIGAGKGCNYQGQREEGCNYNYSTVSRVYIYRCACNRQ